jgi:cytochrome c553
MRIVAVLALAVVGSIAEAGDKELGKHLSSECVSCHQLSGRVVAGVPAIVGIDQESFRAMMESYRRKERPNQVMQSIAAKFTDEEIAALAAFFGGLKAK